MEREREREIDSICRNLFPGIPGSARRVVCVTRELSARSHQDVYTSPDDAITESKLPHARARARTVRSGVGRRFRSGVARRALRHSRSLVEWCVCISRPGKS